jgi:hypothetical protein
VPVTDLIQDSGMRVETSPQEGSQPADSLGRGESGQGGVWAARREPSPRTCAWAATLRSAQTGAG